MKTATMQSFEEFEKIKGESILDARVRHFMKRWQPEDTDDAHRFSADFVMIVREIYRDGSERAHQVMMKMAELSPYPSIFKPDAVTGLTDGKK